MPPRINGYHEIAVVVSDLERSEAFYRDVLCMRVLFRIPGQSVIMMMGEDPHRFLGLWLPDMHSALVGQGIPKMHFTFDVDISDISQWANRFVAYDVKTTKRIKENGDVHIDFDDPDGHPLELWARAGDTLATMPGAEIPPENIDMFHKR